MCELVKGQILNFEEREGSFSFVGNEYFNSTILVVVKTIFSFLKVFNKVDDSCPNGFFEEFLFHEPNIYSQYGYN